MDASQLILDTYGDLWDLFVLSHSITSDFWNPVDCSPPDFSVGDFLHWVPNTQKWIVWRDTHADKARDFIRKGCPGGEQ